MSVRAALIGTVITVVVALLYWGPGVVASIIDRPLIVDCGGIEPARCETYWRDAWPPTGVFERDGLVWSPVTYIRLAGTTPTCAEEIKIERESFTFGLLAETGLALC